MNEIEKLKQENAELKAEILHQNDYILQLSADSEKVKWLNGDIAELKNENAELNAIIDSYQPRLQALKVEIAELQAYKDVNEDYKTAWEELKAENERLNRCMVEVLHHEGDSLRKTIKYQQILQEIKEIAEKEYYKNLVEKDCFVCDTSFWLIINLINKAEEE